MTVNPVPARGLDLTVDDFAPLVPAAQYELLRDLFRRLNEWSDDIIDFLAAFNRAFQESAEMQSVARARITTDGSGGARVLQSKNIENAYPGGGNLIVDLSVEMEGTDYAVLSTARNGGGLITSPLPLGFTTTQFVLDFDSDAGGDVNPATTAMLIWCVVFGKRKSA